jgi:hypothetical protein
MWQLEPPYSDYGLDTDLPQDGLFEYLVVNLSVNVTQPGDFFLIVTLYDGSGIVFITEAFEIIFLDIGVHLVPIRFSGHVIRSSGIDGPYLVDINLFNDMFMMVDSDTYVTGPYLAQDFTTAPAELLPPHSDYGLDTDGDTLLNFLVVDIVVNVSKAAYYEVDTALFDIGGMIFIDSTYNYTYLDAGVETVELRFRGYDIYLAGVDGPYMVDIMLFDDDWNLLGNGTHITQAYLLADFEQSPPAEFSPPHSDHGLDADGDMLLDYLVVDVAVNVDEAGLYLIWGDLYDGTGMAYITGTYFLGDLSSGPQTVELRFSGWDIYSAGIDGPYLVVLELLDYDIDVIDTDTHTTNPYLHTEFNPPPGQFSPPHSDYGLDTDIPQDGYFDFLVLNASVDIDESKMFLVQATLFDDTMSLQLMATNFTQLDTGLQTVELRFGGAGIYASGLDGPYLVLLMFGTIVGEEMVLVDTDFYITNPYSFTEFQPVNPGMIWGYVYEASTGSPLEFATVGAYNYTYGYMNASYTDPTGYYEMNLFEGDFYMVVDESDFQSNLTMDFVSGSTEVTAYLEESPPMSMSSDISFLDWDNSNLSAQMTMEEDNQTLRLQIDFTFGNRDGYLDQGELDLFAWLVGEPPATFSDTTEILLVDGIHYNLDPASFQFGMSGEGPVSSKTPFFVDISGNYSSNTTIPVAPSHLITVNVTYDTTEEESVGYLNVPGTYVLDSFDPAVNVSITGLGTSAIVLDPLGDPDPGDDKDHAWVNLTVVATSGSFMPEVRDVFIDGSSAMTYFVSALPSTFELTAIADDTLSGNSTIGGANYTSPTPVSWPGTPMNALDGAFDEPLEDVSVTVSTPASPGTYDYYVHAWDSIPTYNDSAPYATLTIVDDLKPEISNVLIDGQPVLTVPISSLPVPCTITATIDDSNSGGSAIVGANYTTPTPTSWPGMVMNASDMAYDSPTEDVITSFSAPAVAGTYEYYVHAWDESGNYNDTAPFATLVVLDDIPPEISTARVSGQASITVSPGTDVVLTASIDDMGTGESDIAAANYTLGAMNWPGTPMDPVDGSFDSAQEDVSVSIDTSGWGEGSHQVCVYASDSGQGHNTSSAECAEIVIDETPPSITEVLTEPDLQDVGGEVIISASITDAGGIAEARIEITDPEGISLGNFSMTYDDIAGKYEYSHTCDETGIYTFTIWATDEAGNMASESGDHTIRGAAPAGPLEQYWWVIVLVVIAVVMLVVLLSLKRKPKDMAEEEPRPPPEEESPPDMTERTAEGSTGEEE